MTSSVTVVRATVEMNITIKTKEKQEFIPRQFIKSRYF